MYRKKLILLFISILLLQAALFAQVSSNIRVNQVGFYPKGPKVAVVTGADSLKTNKFFLVKENTADTVFKGSLDGGGFWKYSEENTKKADFSKFETPGSYVLVVPGFGASYPFDIKPHALLDPAKASVRGFYYQRASIELKPEYAGQFARKAGHPDNEVKIHPSAATASRPEGKTISSSRGWYDAGDYNKYIVNSGISTYTLLAVYEDFPAFTDTLKLNIPESNNQIPDLLDEALWNVRWMLTMQDEDGGVYHKLTNANFDAFVMPDQAISYRYVIMKTTAASLDFAALMAQANRVYAKFNKQLPGLADSCLKASIKAYEWSKKNPTVIYDQKEMNDKYTPDVVTGAYDDKNVSDEFQWAAMELFATTGKQQYWDDAKVATANFNIPSWQTVNTLGLYSVEHYKKSLEKTKGLSVVTEDILKIAKPLKAYSETSPYYTPMGTDSNDFVWGSNSTCANEGIALIQAYLITKDKGYLDAAIACADYLLGRNATTFSFLTGYGDHPVMNIHHRPSDADGIKDPVPGLLSGGPNPGQQDKGNSCHKPYPSKLPAKSFLDHKCSYASNEIAINWNAPFAYLTLAIEAIKAQEK